MLDFTCCVMFLTIVSKALVALRLPGLALYFPLPVGGGWGEGISPHRTLH